MKCPYCSSDLDSGVIQAPYPIYWQKNTRALSPPPKRRQEGDIPLNANESFRHGFFHGFYAKAQLCRKCRKIIVDY